MIISLFLGHCPEEGTIIKQYYTMTEEVVKSAIIIHIEPNNENTNSAIFNKMVNKDIMTSSIKFFYLLMSTVY